MNQIFFPSKAEPYLCDWLLSFVGLAYLTNCHISETYFAMKLNLQVNSYTVLMAFHL